MKGPDEIRDLMVELEVLTRIGDRAARVLELISGDGSQVYYLRQGSLGGLWCHELWFEPAGRFRVSIQALFRPGWLEMAQKRENVFSEMLGTLGVRNFRYSRSLDYLL